ncbi:hypothetical protein R9C00_16010 [Flammeovirgaceae bacterium SG7u.111]|nr:hypothetical protein [Flammeovirgaceae bacterium SG7u.132]WPO33207.1 hypothetical protein R9C00_16010 [Flammeovirgaceae bacterium SG7u.111]
MDKHKETPKKRPEDDWRNVLMKERTLLNNVLNNEAELSRATEAGYSRMELYKGLGMIDDIQMADMTYEEKLSKKEKQNAISKQSMANLEKEYLAHLKTAKSLFSKEEKNISQKLKLEGDIPNTASGKTDKITQFYSVALQEKRATRVFQKNDISVELMEQMQNLVDEVMINNQLADKKSDTAAKHLKDLEKKRTAFGEWMEEFKATYQLVPVYVPLNPSKKKL